MIVAGVDEAGYGPTLGPLVVSAAAFRVPERLSRETGSADLWAALSSAVSREKDPSRIRVDDSKRVFQQRKGLKDLEEGLLPFFAARGRGLPKDLRALIARVSARRRSRAGSPADYLERYPWYRGRTLGIPVSTFAGFAVSRGRMLEAALADAGVEFLGLASQPLEVFEFNEALERCKVKSRVSLRLVGSFLRRLWARFPGEDVEVTVDRQGGRARYGPILYKLLGPRGIRTEEETDAVSAYLVSRPKAPSAKGGGPGSFRVRFVVDAERLSLPAALASMCSKYIRELHMALFNRFWTEKQKGLKPTAGYVVDARRFLEETAALRESLRIDDRLLVRRR
ncbi:MAG: hypothetical protein ACUVYA_20200 [Planctomycetota bacterium]